MTHSSFGGLGFLVLALAGSVDAQDKRPIQTEDMFDMRSVGAPGVSPDGAWIAYTLGRTSLEDERSYTRIYMSSAEGGEAVGLTVEGKSAGSPGGSPDCR